MRWYEGLLLTFGLFLIGNGLLHWFGWLRAERDTNVIVRTRKVAALWILLGLAVLAVLAVLVLG